MIALGDRVEYQESGLLFPATVIKVLDRRMETVNLRVFDPSGNRVVKQVQPGVRGADKTWLRGEVQLAEEFKW